MKSLRLCVVPLLVCLILSDTLTCVTVPP